MRILSDYSAITFTAFFVLGIIFQKLFAASLVILLFALALPALFYFIFRRRRDLNWIQKTTMFSAAFILGAVLLSINGKEKITPLFEEFFVKNYQSSGKIVSLHLPSKETFSLHVEIDSAAKNARAKIIILRVKSSRTSFEKQRQDFSIGNKISFSGMYSQGRDRRNPGEFDYKNYLLSEGISGIVFVKSIDSITQVSSEPKIFANVIFNLRYSIKKTIDKYFDLQTAALMNALIIADKSELSFETKKNFIETGVVHVLAVSGLHVAFVTIVFLFFFGRFELIWRISLTILGLGFFLIITDSPASVMRASIMAAVILISYPSGRSTYGLNSLAVAALIILFFNPSDLFHPGFQLSFSAVISILLLTPALNNLFNTNKFKNKVAKYFLTFFSVSLAAQIGTLPFTTYYFSKISLVALAANLFVIPLIAFILGGGIGVMIFSFFSNHVADAVAQSVNLLTTTLNFIVNQFAAFDYSYLRVANFSLLDGLIVLSFIIFFGIIFSEKRSLLFTILFPIILFLNADLFIQFDDEKLFEENKLNVMMIDIGQGDSFLIQFPNGKIALLDAGNATPAFDNGEKIIQPLLEYLEVDKINYALVSHLDADHYAGFHSLIQKGLVEKVLKPSPDTSFKKDVEFEKFIRSNNLPIEYFNGRTEIDPSVRIYNFVNHMNDGFKSKTTNERSSFFLMKHGEAEILFTGDANSRVEKFVASKFASLLDVDVLKVGHHGSKTSSSEYFLNLAKPEISLISAGINNMFKHPSKDVLTRLEKYSEKLFRTDLTGATILISDGKNFRVKDWKSLSDH